MNWIILRTHVRDTLRLAKTLNEDGYEAWAPTETRTIKIPSRNVRRTALVAILPRYVFVRENHLVELISLSRLSPIPRRQNSRPENGPWLPYHPEFKVMRLIGGYRSIPDGELAGLRQIEEELSPRARVGKKAKSKSAAFGKNAMVKVSPNERAWSGKTGKVMRSNNTTTLVLIDGRKVNLSTSLLLPDGIEQTVTPMGLAA